MNCQVIIWTRVWHYIYLLVLIVKWGITFLDWIFCWDWAKPSLERFLAEKKGNHRQKRPTTASDRPHSAGDLLVRELDYKKRKVFSSPAATCNPWNESDLGWSCFDLSDPIEFSSPQLPTFELPHKVWPLLFEEDRDIMKQPPPQDNNFLASISNFWEDEGERAATVKLFVGFRWHREKFMALFPSVKERLETRK